LIQEGRLIRIQQPPQHDNLQTVSTNVSIITEIRFTTLNSVTNNYNNYEKYNTENSKKLDNSKFEATTTYYNG